jgi:Uma2 family endonuclease
VVPRVRSADNVRVPDLAVTCAPPSRERLLAEPVLLIEILSPSNADETWANVWAYTTIPSVTEILVVSRTAIGAELLRRLPDGSWPEAPQSLDQSATLELASIGFRLPIASLYRTTALL